MATKTLYLKDALASGSAFLSLQDGGTAPGTATTATGWAVQGAAAAHFSRMDSQSERLANTFSEGIQPSGVLDNSLGDAFRTENKIKGAFEPGNWTLAFPLISTVAGGTHDVRVICRIWKGPNADGSGADLVSTSYLPGSVASNLTTTEQVSSITWACPGVLCLDEYIFVQVALQIVDPTAQAGQTAMLRVGSAATVTTTEFGALSLWITADGANGSTTFTDDSGNGISVTAGGNAQVSTASPRTGSGAALFDGAGDALQTVANAALQLPADFTVLLDVKSTQTSSAGLIGTLSTIGGGGWLIQINNGGVSGDLRVFESAAVISGSTIVNNGAWHRVELSRKGTTLRLFHDGALVGSATSSYSYNSNNVGLTAGQYFGGANDLNGRLDNIVVIKGVALHTAAHAVGAELQADGQSIATATAVLADDRLFADATSTATASAGLTAQILAAASASGVATGTASLSAAPQFQAAAQVVWTASGTLTDYIIPRPAVAVRREYEQYFRGPMPSPTIRLASLDAVHGGESYASGVTEFSSPSDTESDDFGIQTAGEFDVRLANVDIPTITAALRDQECELTLLTRLYLEDGSTQEVVHTRRGVVRGVTQEKHIVTLRCAALDRSALRKRYPFDRFTVADFPNLFADDVGKVICEGVGTVLRVPLVQVDNTGGTYVYAGPRVLSSAGTLLAVYRGYESGKNPPVNAAEYSASTKTGLVSGIVVNTVVFQREQLDTSGRRYVLEADYLLPGTRTAAAELARIAPAFGLDIDAASAAAASGLDLDLGFTIDALYGAENRQQGQTGQTILEYLLLCARAWLVDRADGTLGLVQDVSKPATLQFNAQADEVDLVSWADGPRVAKLTVKGRPRVAGSDDYALILSRDCTGADGEKVIALPYVYDFGTLDRIASYWQARINTTQVGQATLHAQQLTMGDCIALTDPLYFVGQRQMIVTGLTRPADKNEVGLRGYDSSVYAYSASTPPAGATNGYSVDYSYAIPAAPGAAPTYVGASSGTELDADGKVTAFALLRIAASALPAVNWASVFFLLVDDDNDTQRVVEALLNGANYEAKVPTLRVGRPHLAYAFVKNANGLSGTLSASASFTSATSVGGPAAPTGLAYVQQVGGAGELTWNPVSGQNVRRYEVQKSTVSSVSGFNTINFVDGTVCPLDSVTYGATVWFRIRAEDNLGNPGTLTSALAVSPVPLIDSSHITSGGVANVNMASNSVATANVVNSAITGAKTDVASSINNFFGVGAGAVIQLTSNQGLWSTVNLQQFTCVGGGGPSNTRWRNDGGSTNVTAYENYWS